MEACWSYSVGSVGLLLPIMYSSSGSYVVLWLVTGKD